MLMLIMKNIYNLYSCLLILNLFIKIFGVLFFNKYFKNVLFILCGICISLLVIFFLYMYFCDCIIRRKRVGMELIFL